MCIINFHAVYKDECGSLSFDVSKVNIKCFTSHDSFSFLLLVSLQGQNSVIVYHKFIKSEPRSIILDGIYENKSKFSNFVNNSRGTRSALVIFPSNLGLSFFFLC